MENRFEPVQTRRSKEARLSLEELQGTEHQILLCLVLNQGISRIATMHA
jgi:hypothetical protein